MRPFIPEKSPMTAIATRPQNVFDTRTDALLAQLERDGLYKHLRMLESPMDAAVNAGEERRERRRGRRQRGLVTRSHEGHVVLDRAAETRPRARA